MAKHVVLVAAQKKSQPSLPIQIMLLFLHSYMRWSYDRYITAPPGKPNMEQALSSYCSCPLSAPECSCKLCSETRNELCSMFGIKGRIQPIDLKWGTLLRCLHFGAGAQDPSVVHGNTAPLKWLKTGIFTHTEIPVHKWWLVDNIAGSLLLS